MRHAGRQSVATHGGSTTHSKRRAKERLEQAAEPTWLRERCLGIAHYDAEAKPIKLAQPIKDALDRAGLGPKDRTRSGGFGKAMASRFWAPSQA